MTKQTRYSNIQLFCLAETIVTQRPNRFTLIYAFSYTLVENRNLG